jgi:membrane fusion protein (multidrug efflux system)
MKSNRSWGNKFYTVLLWLILVAAAVMVWYRFFQGEGGKRQSAKAPPPPVTVEIITVTPRIVENTVSAVGTILANESVTIKPEIAGKINFIGFQEGALVEQGKTLFMLDSALLAAEYQEVKANYDFAQNQYERARRLQKDGVIPSEEYDERLRAHLNAKARLNTIATRLQKHTIQAPFRGRVGARVVSAGDYVAAGEPLVTIDDLSTVKIEFYLSQRLAEKISLDHLVRVGVEPFPAPFEGTVYLIDPQFDAESRSARVRATISNAEEALKPGMFCTVTVLLDKKERGLVVPAEALLSRGEKTFLFVEKDGQALMQEVTLGIFTGNSVEILDGIAPGDRVVSAGIQKLSPGIPVRAIRAEAKP